MSHKCSYFLHNVVWASKNRRNAADPIRRGWDGPAEKDISSAMEEPPFIKPVSSPSSPMVLWLFNHAGNGRRWRDAKDRPYRTCGGARKHCLKFYAGLGGQI